MRAAIYNRYGGPEVLSLGDVAQPEPGDDELLIETRAAEVTKADCEMRRFSFPVKQQHFGGQVFDFEFQIKDKRPDPVLCCSFTSGRSVIE